MAAAHTFIVPELQALVTHTIPADELGTFFFASEPAHVLACDVQGRVLQPHTKQDAKGITLWFDATFVGGKIKVTT
jgi:hypothetical protein